MHKHQLMPIGRFSKSCRLSIKALRHYDEQGLLKPAYVDPDSGYRYYSHYQASTAVMIGMLRSLDIPLANIKPIIQATDEAQRCDLLFEEQQRIANNLIKQQQILQSIVRISRATSLFPYDISTREEPSYCVASIFGMTTDQYLLTDSTQLVYDLISELQTAGRNLKDPVMCINADPDKQERIQVQACIGVEPPYPSLSRAEIIEIPGGLVAWLTHQGAYEELGIAYHALFAWIQENGYEQRDAMREMYLNDPAEVATEELLTEVMLPVIHRQ